MPPRAAALLCALAGARGYVVYNHSCEGDGFWTTSNCGSLSVTRFNTSACAVDASATPAQQRCAAHEPVLLPWPQNVDMMIEHSSRDYYVCALQRDVCASVERYQENAGECSELFGGCRRALRHLHRMMFADEDPVFAGVFDTVDDEAQVCNNFARKSVRGFFHDFMSNHIDGSVL